MLDFGKPVELHFTEIDFNELVSDSVRVAQPMAKENGVELETGLALSLPSVVLDAPRVKQILLNLITNAIQASTAGDHVRVCTSLNSLGVVLEVSDHGGGIAKKYRESIFHPFFSTKREGTGLGLGIVKKIVETHGGDVSFSANQEKGVTFTVRLPLRPET
ncbi:MAG: ATP-binding protein, partial [Desulfobacteraceae bacterium]|nr:ATP-binding protein [Desulfobacteraceae bacterium]